MQASRIANTTPLPIHPTNSGMLPNIVTNWRWNSASVSQSTRCSLFSNACSTPAITCGTFAPFSTRIENTPTPGTTPPCFNVSS